MADPRTGRFTLFNAITATTTTELHTVAGNQGQYFASSIIFEVVGSATPNWTLAFQGKSVPGGTYTALDYIQIWQAGAAAPSTSSLTVNDATVRFYLVPNAPQFVQAVATRTTGTLTVYFSYTSMPFTQLLAADSSGNQQVVLRSAGNTVTVSNPNVDNLSQTLPGLSTLSLLYGLDGGATTWSRVWARGDADGLAGGMSLYVQGRKWVFQSGLWSRERGVDTFKTATATASGNTAVWTPATGKKFRLMGFIIMLTDQATQTTAGNLEVTFQDATTAIGLGASFYVPSTAISAVGMTTTGFVSLGNGFISATANNVLNVNLGAALTAGEIRVTAMGTEE